MWLSRRFVVTKLVPAFLVCVQLVHCVVYSLHCHRMVQCCAVLASAESSSPTARRGAGRVIGVALITEGGWVWGGASCCVRVSSDHPAGPNASGPGGWRLFITADLLATRCLELGRRPKLVRAKLQLRLAPSNEQFESRVQIITCVRGWRPWLWLLISETLELITISAQLLIILARPRPLPPSPCWVNLAYAQC